jgi:hypothetical protein
VCYGSGHVLQTAGIVWWDGEPEALSRCNALWLMVKLLLMGFIGRHQQSAIPRQGQAPSGQKKPDSKTGYGQNLEFSHKRKLFVAQQQTI